MKRMVAVGILLLAGCAAAPVPPMVDADMLALAARRDIAPATLERGRDLYMNRCTKCHGFVGLEKYDPKKRQEVLDRMADRAKLGVSESRDLATYLEVARLRESEAQASPVRE